MRRTVLAALALAALAALGAGGCKGGRFSNMYSRDDEIKMGKQFAAEFEKDPKTRLITRGAEYERLQRVAARVFPLARRDWDVPYSVHLVESDEVNAFAVPGGPIYFYKGLMDLAKTEDEVASVLGHEASHIVRRHSARQLSDAQGKALLAEILLGGSRSGQTVAGLIVGVTSLRFSRDDESQADEYGFKYLVQAGYDPGAMASFFERMMEKNGSGGLGRAGDFLSSHPLTRKRIDKARERAGAYRAGVYEPPK